MFNTLDNQSQKWVIDTLAGMSLEDKIAQTFFPIAIRYGGEGKRSEQFIEFTEKYCTGGGFLFNTEYNKLRDIVDDYTGETDIPIIYAGDYECGVAIGGGAPFGSAMNLAAIDDLDKASKLSYEAGKAAATQGKAVGARWTFSPVVDINYNPDSPITNVRTYGNDPERISAISAAYIKGLQDHGMAATAKHFPGDGMDSRDQHLVTTINSLDYNEWLKTYGKTFRSAFDAGVYTVMPGHIALKGKSGNDEKGLLPATIDPAILKDLLRDELGFDGLIVSDALEMKGVTSRCKNEQDVVIKTLAAGADMMLFVNSPMEDLAAVLKAIEDGTLSVERIDDAVTRILSLKAKLNITSGEKLCAEANQIDAYFDNSQYTELSEQIAESSITLMRDLNKDIPLKLDKGATITLCYLPDEYVFEQTIGVETEDHNKSDKPFIAQELEKRGYNVNIAEAPADIREMGSESDAIIYLSNCVPRAFRGSIKISRAAQAYIDCKLINSDKPVIFVSEGNPYTLDEIPYLPNYIVTYSNRQNIENALVKGIFGEIDFKGKCPVKLAYS